MNTIVNSRIAVFGDLMLDYNTYTKATKIANEAPIPVFQQTNENYFLGGAGNVLKNLAALECSALYAFGVVGCDSYGAQIHSLCKENRIIDCIETLNNYSTIVKHRYFSDHKIVFRCDVESNKQSIKIDNEILRTRIETICQEGLDCIILSDYNKGYLNHERCQMIIQLANKYNIITLVDPKEDYTKYIGCTCIKPNRKEAYHIFNVPGYTPIEEVHKIIKTRIGCTYSVITMAEEGISVSTSTELIQTSTHVQQTVDVTGAGDVVTAIFGFLLANHAPISIIAETATRVATISVQYPGTYTIQKSDLRPDTGSKILEVKQLSMLHEIHKDKRIAFTNGCFDIIHNGHIELFKFCKQKGDIVVVGLNSDASITRLKGSSRPIHSQTTRIAVLEAISLIDYIVLFEEDTPYELIKSLKPYYLIKGGDYSPDSIIGREYATETIVCDLVAGVSTTSAANKLMNL
jgi:D-beta-D-heptose 7-phosphate kinase/D-beta-D-heptose 1-phosphate adenosyltransferase